MKRFIINFVYFSKRYFFFVPFRLTTVNFWYDRKMVRDSCCRKTDLIELEMRLVISRSSQWPWTWVGKLPCCFRSKHVRISLNLLVFPFDLSRCMLESSIYTNCHAVKLCSLVDLEIHQKIDMYRFEAYTGRQRNHCTNCSRYVQRSLRTF